MVKVGLTIVSKVESVEIVVFKVILSSAIETSFGRRREAKRLDQVSWDQPDLSDASLLSATLDHLAIVVAPCVVLTDVSVRSVSDDRPSGPLIFLDLDIFKALVLVLRWDLNEVQAILLSECYRRLVVGVETSVLHHFEELTRLLIILSLGLLVERSVLFELLTIVVNLAQV